MAHKRKADCTPEEWEKILEKDRMYQREYYKKHPKKKKKDYTKEEWDVFIQKKHEYYLQRKAAGKIKVKRKSDYTEKEWREKLNKSNKSRKIKHKADCTEDEWNDYLKKHKQYEKHKQDYTEEEWRAFLDKKNRYRKNHLTDNKDAIEKERKRDREWRKANIEKVKESRKRSKKNNKLKFSTYAHQLTIDEDPIQDENGYLMVRDYYTKEYFYPKRQDVENRINALKGVVHGESHLYSCIESKISCPVFHLSYDPNTIKSHTGHPGRINTWRDMVISRADGHCERCGKKCDSLIAHHKVPVASCAMMAADIDNGMALCPECHREVHSTDGCRLHELAAEKRKTA